LQKSSVNVGQTFGLLNVRDLQACDRAQTTVLG
jgi:hypothetical protein